MNLVYLLVVILFKFNQKASADQMVFISEINCCALNVIHAVVLFVGFHFFFVNFLLF